MTCNWRIVRAPLPVQILRRSAPTEWQECQHENSETSRSCRAVARASGAGTLPCSQRAVEGGQFGHSQFSEEGMGHVFTMMRDMRRAFASDRSESRPRSVVKKTGFIPFVGGLSGDDNKVLDGQCQVSPRVLTLHEVPRNFEILAQSLGTLSRTSRHLLQCIGTP